MQYHDPDLAKRFMYDLIEADVVAKNSILEANLGFKYFKGP